MEFIRLTLGYGSMNCYILYDEKTRESAIIDPGYDFDVIKTQIEKLNLSPKYILLTHSHGDHIGAISELKEKYPEIKLGIHKDEVELLETPELNFSKEIQGIPISLTPDFTFVDGDEIILGSEKIKIIHTPGHSPGGSCFYVDDKVFVGDTLFKRSIGRTDLYKGDSIQLLNAIASKLFILSNETLVFPGHGGETTIGEEKERNPFF